MILAGMALLSAGCARQSENAGTSAGPQKAEDFLPAEIDGKFTRAELIDAPTRQKVEDLINGESGLYYAYDLVKLTRGVYSAPKDDKKIIIDIYTMPTVNDAFGAYTNWRQGVDKAGDVFELTGEIQAARNEGVNFRTGRYFIRVFSKSGAAGVEETAEAIAKMQFDDGKFKQPEPDLPHMQQLPQAGRTENSIIYVKQNFRGFKQLQRAVAAEYKIEKGDEFECFICAYKTPEKAADAMKAFGKSVEALGIKPNISGDTLTYADEFSGKMTMIRAGRFIAAATGGQGQLASDMAEKLSR